MYKDKGLWGFVTAAWAVDVVVGHGRTQSSLARRSSPLVEALSSRLRLSRKRQWADGAYPFSELGSTRIQNLEP